MLTAILVHPLQHPDLSVFCRRPARFLVALTDVCVCPLQHVEVSTPRRKIGNVPVDQAISPTPMLQGAETSEFGGIKSIQLLNPTACRRHSVAYRTTHDCESCESQCVWQIFLG
tara:strand:+ start:35704 stop:36045 length:342 start_codon:yes stop_codon:yes gene_type:complete